MWAGTTALLLREYDRNDGYLLHAYATEECDLYLTGLFPLLSLIVFFNEASCHVEKVHIARNYGNTWSTASRVISPTACEGLNPANTPVSKLGSGSFSS